MITADVHQAIPVKAERSHLEASEAAYEDPAVHPAPAEALAVSEMTAGRHALRLGLHLTHSESPRGMHRQYEVDEYVLGVRRHLAAVAEEARPIPRDRPERLREGQAPTRRGAPGGVPGQRRL